MLRINHMANLPQNSIVTQIRARRPMLALKQKKQSPPIDSLLSIVVVFRREKGNTRCYGYRSRRIQADR